jgi:hypothetical protein
MSTVSRASAPYVTDYGPAEDRGAQFDGYAVVFTSVREDWNLAPVLKGSPGDALYMPPGHVPAVAAGTELVMFQPAR